MKNKKEADSRSALMRDLAQLGIPADVKKSEAALRAAQAQRDGMVASHLQALRAWRSAGKGKKANYVLAIGETFIASRAAEENLLTAEGRLARARQKWAPTLRAVLRRHVKPAADNLRASLDLLHAADQAAIRLGMPRVLPTIVDIWCKDAMTRLLLDETAKWR